MKKITSLTLISSVALLLITGCGGSGPTAENEGHNDAKISKNALYVNTYNNKKLAKAIQQAGEESGWKITKFKTNAVVAEKVNEDNTYATTLKFNNGHVEFENAEGTTDSDVEDLRDAIENIANAESSEH